MIESKDDMRRRRLPSPDRADTAVMLFSGCARPPFLDWPSDVRQMIAEDDLITSVARGTYRASVRGKPPIGRNVVFSGVKIFCIADGKIVERWRPERSSRSRARSQTCGSPTRRR
jgi:hypothetical protein